VERVPGEITAEVFATVDGDAVVVAFGPTVRVVFDVGEALAFASDVAVASMVCEEAGRRRRRGSAGPPAPPVFRPDPPNSP
jgi:hypothetical protein